MYKERKAQISRTCRKYGLGRFQQQPRPAAAGNTVSGGSGHEGELASDGGDDKVSELARRTELYAEMEATFQTPLVNSFMWQRDWHLLYCWIHKVRVGVTVKDKS